MKTIVIFMQNRNFFGAQIVHFPLISKLKKKYPDSRIILFSKYNIANILGSFKEVDEVVVETSRLETIKKYLSLKADITISLRKQSFFTYFLMSFLNFKTTIGYRTLIMKFFLTRTVMYDVKIYRANNYLRLLGFKEECLKVSKKRKSFVLIPGAGKDFKMWSVKNYIDLAKKLGDLYPNYSVDFIIGEKEKAMMEFIPSHFNIHFNVSIHSLFDSIQKSSFVVANDCGPSHIAQIADTKNIILFSDEKGTAKSVVTEWFNDKKNGYYLFGDEHQSINTIKVDKVLSLINNHLED